MSILKWCAPLLHPSHPKFINQSNLYPPFLTLQTTFQLRFCSYSTKTTTLNQRVNAKNFQGPIEVEHYNITDDMDEEEDIDEDKDDEEEFSALPRGFRGREEEKDYDKDPEFGEILGTCLDDPQKAQSIMEERLRKKRNKILHTKTGSATPMEVKFNKFDFCNSYIWFEFFNVPLEKDVALLCDAIRSWHIVGRLGGCNSLNMQLSQSPLDKRPSYDYIQGGNVTPTTFYNIGDLEIQDKLARIWVDIGTSEPLILDILINALTQISSDYFGIKQVVFGGSEFENWGENLTSEDVGYSVHKI